MICNNMTNKDKAGTKKENSDKRPERPTESIEQMGMGGKVKNSSETRITRD